jgi:yecA family protein
MPTSSQYKLLRHGNVRTGARASHGMSRSGRYSNDAHALVPNIEEFGHQPFGEHELQALARQLQDPALPRDTLNIYGLEGLLTALLVLPIGLRPGAWLPLIWNETGWKIPVALQGPDLFGHFIEATIGFMRMIDAGLMATPPHFASTLDTLGKSYRPKASDPQQADPKHAWARGFGLTMTQNNWLRVEPDAATRRNLYTIGTHASQASADSRARSNASQTLQQAVLALTAIRSSRGPLGSLPKPPKATPAATVSPRSRSAL